MKIRQRILLHGILHVLVADMGIDLRGVQLLVSEDVLEHADIHLAALVHQCRCGVAELVNR